MVWLPKAIGARRVQTPRAADIRRADAGARPEPTALFASRVVPVPKPPSFLPLGSYLLVSVKWCVGRAQAGSAESVSADPAPRRAPLAVPASPSRSVPPTGARSPVQKKGS